MCSDRWTISRLMNHSILGRSGSSWTWSPVFCINNSHQQQQRTLCVSRCSAVREWREWSVLFFSCEGGAEVHTELPERSTFTRPGLYSAVARGSTHTQDTDAGCEVSVWRKHAHNHTRTHVHTCTHASSGAHLGLLLLLLGPVTHHRHPDQTSSCLTAHRAKREKYVVVLHLHCWHKIQSFSCCQNAISSLSESF